MNAELLYWRIQDALGNLPNEDETPVILDAVAESWIDTLRSLGDY